MPTMSDASDGASRTSSLFHQDDCSLHDDPRNGLCSAFTYAKRLCKFRAKISETGYLPVCKLHSYNAPYQWMKDRYRAGRCQATEKCGQLCNRISKYDAPYHLCDKHQMGSDTLPCYIMELPTELRLMIFRYLFPKTVPSRRPHGVAVALLKTNRQIYQEASSVLYSESRFEARIRPMSIELQGKVWHREPVAKNLMDDYSVGNILCQSSAGLIRNLEVALTVGIKQSRCPKGVGWRGITQEDHDLYTFRDSVRKFAEYFRPVEGSSNKLNVLKQLKISPSVSLDYGWGSDEATIALFAVLEPLQILRPEKMVLEAPIAAPSRYAFGPGKQIIAEMPSSAMYSKLKEQLPKAGRDLSGALKPVSALEAGYRKIEAFAQLLHVQDVTTSHSWTSTTFQYLERPLHLARVAYENDDLEMMRKIREAIKLRWINAHRQQEVSKRAVANSINTMFKQEESEIKLEDEGDSEVEETDDDGMPTPRELYPDAFEFDVIRPLKLPYAANQANFWPELSTVDTAPKRGDPGVTTTIGLLRICIWKDKKVWSRLKTPALIRQLQED
jgi:hypothetical protein